MGAVEDCPWYCGLPMADCECESKLNLKAIEWIDDAEKAGYKTCSTTSSEVRENPALKCDDTSYCVNVHVKEFGVQPDMIEEKCVPLERTAQLVARLIYENLEKDINNEPVGFKFREEAQKILDKATECDPSNPITCDEGDTCSLYPMVDAIMPNKYLCLKPYSSEMEQETMEKLQRAVNIYKSSRQAM